MSINSRPYCTFCGGDFGKHAADCRKASRKQFLVIAVRPNGDVERITTRQQLADARAEGLKPIVFSTNVKENPT